MLVSRSNLSTHPPLIGPGYYIFEECGDMVNPTLGLEVGETYTFIQNDRTNYMVRTIEIANNLIQFFKVI